MTKDRQIQAIRVFADFNEIAVKIKWDNGNTIERFFPTCEDAWFWERDTIRTSKRRRAKADRLHVASSMYAGCTSQGETYGGKLGGTVSDSDLEQYQLEQYLRAKRHAISKGYVMEKRRVELR